MKPTQGSHIIGRNLLIHMDLSTGSSSTAITSSGANVVTRPFVVAIALLGTAALLSGPLSNWLEISNRKYPLPLRAPLATLNEDSIAPYRVVQREVLDPAVVEALGTNRYLSWVLEDTDVPETDPLRRAHLLVTYDSGGNNLVPHTPEVCWFGGGYQRAQPHKNVEIDISGEPGENNTVPIRVCTFVKTALRNRAKRSVVYTFHCNGQFVCTRTGVRLLINRPTNRYAYFSKVEVTFETATREQTLQGAKKLFDRLLPVLVDRHWPDFEAAEDAARNGSSEEG